MEHFPDLNNLMDLDIPEKVYRDLLPHCKFCNQSTEGRKFCGECGRPKAFPNEWKNASHVQRACYYIRDPYQNLSLQFQNQSDLIHHLQTDVQLRETTSQPRIGVSTIATCLTDYRKATKGPSPNMSDLAQFPKNFDWVKQGNEAILACLWRRNNSVQTAQPNPSSSLPPLPLTLPSTLLHAQQQQSQTQSQSQSLRQDTKVKMDPEECIEDPDCLGFKFNGFGFNGKAEQAKEFLGF